MNSNASNHLKQIVQIWGFIGFNKICLRFFISAQKFTLKQLLISLKKYKIVNIIVWTM